MRDHFSHWEKTGVPHFSLSVIKESYNIRLEDCPAGMKYKEKNNKSYEKHEAFPNEGVAKMERIKVVERVKKEDCRFINPLTVAVNNEGKKRLCIDLSVTGKCHSLPRRCSSPRRPRVTLLQPSWRVSLFPSEVWNSPVVQKTDCRLQQ